MRAAKLTAVAWVLLAATAGHAQERWLDQSGVQRWTRGHYVYRKLSTGQENGQEEFLLVVDRDGVRTLRASNAYIDRAEVWRHVIYRVDAHLRPLDLYVDYNVAGQWRGAGYFTIGADTMRGVVSGPDGSHEMTLKVPEYFSLIPHPIASNSWPAWYYDRKLGGRQTVTLYALDGQAQDQDGILGEFQQQSLVFRGTGKIHVPAGEFSCDSFAFNDGDPVICLTGADQLIVKMTWKFADVEYLLSDWTSSPSRAQGEEP